MGETRTSQAGGKTLRARAWLLPLLAGGIFSIPALFAGFSNDDLIHRLSLEHGVPDGLDWFGLYDFTPARAPATLLIERGILPWFTNPELKLRFLRPLSSLTLALDSWLFGRNALLAHLQSLLWFSFLVVLAAKLYARWFSARAARLAGLVFALSSVHAVPLAWLAARHTLVAAAFGVAALLAQIRFREDAWRPGRALALALLAASLLASESGLVALVLMVGYEIGTRGLRRGVRAASAPLALGVLYLAAYAALGFGASGSSFYVSPFDSPWRYLRAALVGVPTLCVELLLGLPSAAAAFVPGAGPVFIAVGTAAALTCGWLLRALRAELSASARITLTWLGLATLASLPALVGAVVTGRVLPLPMLGAAALSGNALAALGARARAAPSGAAPRLRKAWLVPLVLIGFLNFALSPLLRVGGSLQFRQYALAERRLASEADLGACTDHGYLYLLNGADPMLSLSAAEAIRFYTPEKAGARRFRVLSMAPQAQRLERVAPSAFELEVAELPRRQNRFEQLYRAAEKPLTAGAQFRTSELEVSVLEASDGAFTRARFELAPPTPITDVCLLVWRNARLEQLAWPALGESVRIAYERGPMGL